jgi:predicted metalloprotease with PDZ domain
MWRGGLSGPGSLFLHAHRPLITEDGTSPILHEVVHTALRLRPGPDGDWAIEGLAEYYSLEVLGRSGTVSPERLLRAFEMLAKRGTEAAHLRSKSVSGAGTARAVTVLRALDRRIRDATDQTRGIDDVARLLVRDGGTVTTARVQELAEQVSGLDLAGFFASEVP